MMIAIEASVFLSRRDRLVWFLGIVVGIMTSLNAYSEQQHPDWSWPHISLLVGKNILPIVVSFAGVAYWYGVRDKLTRESNPAIGASPDASVYLASRLAVVLMGTSMSMLILIAAGTIMGFATHAWGSPSLSLIFAAWLASVAASSLSYLLGVYCGILVLAPLVPFGWWAAYAVVVISNSRFTVLLPSIFDSSVVSDIWYGPSPYPLILIFTAYCVVVIVATIQLLLQVGSSYPHSTRSLIIPATSIAIAALIVLSAPKISSTSLGEVKISSPQCSVTETVRVCVHPAHRDALPSISQSVNGLLQPVAGLSGVPTFLSELPYRYEDHDKVAPGATQIWINNQNRANSDVIEIIALRVVTGNVGGEITSRFLTWSQAVAYATLTERIGYEGTLPATYFTPNFRSTSSQEQVDLLNRSLEESVTSLLTLTDSELQQWFQRNLQPIQAGDTVIDEPFFNTSVHPPRSSDSVLVDDRSHFYHRHTRDHLATSSW